jgi:hypothetical protein
MRKRRAKNRIMSEVEERVLTVIKRDVEEIPKKLLLLKNADIRHTNIDHIHNILSRLETNLIVIKNAMDERDADKKTSRNKETVVSKRRKRN